MMPDQAVDSVAHIVQVALTPVFLLSGIGTLLNVFNTRLSRVVDHFEHVAELLAAEHDFDKQAALARHLARLRTRRFALDSSVLLASAGAVATCGAVWVLFLGGVREQVVATWLYALFGVALGCSICALVAFLVDNVMAWHGLRREGALPPSGLNSRSGPMSGPG
jgi:uncharacterized protein YfiM (DUF2279 family)